MRTETKRPPPALTPLAAWLPAGVLLVAGIVGPAVSPGSPAGARIVGADTVPDRRPIPDPVVPSRAYRRAVERGTRTPDGRPGPRYWTNRARYRIEVRLDTAEHRVTGREEISYLNRSPDTLRRVAVHLRQNLFARGAVRLDEMPVTGGVDLREVRAGGRTLTRAGDGGGAGGARPGGSYRVEGTLAWLDLPEPLLPGDSLKLAFAWSHRPPPAPADGRQGREAGLYYMGYWYPQVGVYDDVAGWVAEPYTGRGEFYMGRADYDVRITAPEGWPVAATGVLQNPGEVLSERSRRRITRARRTGDVVAVIRSGERADGRVTAGGSRGLTWHFRAEDVRDFAWSATRDHLWDATRALVPSRGDDAGVRTREAAAPDTVMIHSFFRDTEAARAWPTGGARYTRDAVESLSRVLWPYPYPHMTSVEGVLDGGGMEYPMMTVMQPWADTLKLAGDLTHEVAHAWFPMEVGTDEKRWVWMDEGLTQFNTAQAMARMFGAPREGGRPNDSERGQRELYLEAAGADGAAPLMRHGDRYPGSYYFVLPYDKGAQVLAALRGLVGEEAFREAYREFGRRWRGGHPYPWDFFRTFEDVTERELDWFWTSWLHETWILDQAVAGVRTEGDSTAIVIEDRGRVPMPVRLRVVRADGSTERIEVPVDVWLDGSRRHVVRVPAGEPAVTSVEIDPEESFPDVDRSNQIWHRKGG